MNFIKEDNKNLSSNKKIRNKQKLLIKKFEKLSYCDEEKNDNIKILQVDKKISIDENKIKSLVTDKKLVKENTSYKMKNKKLEKNKSIKPYEAQIIKNKKLKFKNYKNDIQEIKTQITDCSEIDSDEGENTKVKISADVKKPSSEQRKNIW